MFKYGLRDRRTCRNLVATCGWRRTIRFADTRTRGSYPLTTHDLGARPPMYLFLHLANSPAGFLILFDLRVTLYTSTDMADGAVSGRPSRAAGVSIALATRDAIATRRDLCITKSD
ncbi:hypothetical protein EVAR_54113_1 [Eumeta japonica]|uniref:Uncharacterized protein n=1 Tax=Eumeta variegata TaxID=151549 RepID=A0A4C1Z237_EUMVA|nr:hypothetical protein EVAR_54113_1 [Eumeta japonica]